jgi:hypothetical protein
MIREHEESSPLPGQLLLSFMHAGRGRRKRTTTEQGASPGGRRADPPSGADRQKREGRKKGTPMK